MIPARELRLNERPEPTIGPRPYLLGCQAKLSPHILVS